MNLQSFPALHFSNTRLPTVGTCYNTLSDFPAITQIEEVQKELSKRRTNAQIQNSSRVFGWIRTTGRQKKFVYSQSTSLLWANSRRAVTKEGEGEEVNDW